MPSMLKFDQNTIANMTAALDYAYKKIPLGMDNPPFRKRIADAVTRSAEEGQGSLSQLKDAGLVVINEILFQSKRSWLTKRRLF
jgi:hypothetical protein